MQLYKISDKGELYKLDKLNFEKNDVYLVDDKEKYTIYIWVGLSVPQEKKNIIAEVPRNLDKERGGSAKILIMKQKREFGTFLAMLNDLKKGEIPGKTVDRSPEFKFEVPLKSIKTINITEYQAEREIKMEERITEWLKQLKEHRKAPVNEDLVEETIEVEESKEPEESKELEESDLKNQIREAAYFLALDKYSYNELCWILGEKIQKMNLPMPSMEDIKKKAEEVFKSNCTWDELCYLIAELDILTRKTLLQETKKKAFDY